MFAALRSARPGHCQAIVTPAFWNTELAMLVAPEVNAVPFAVKQTVTSAAAACRLIISNARPSSRSSSFLRLL